MKLINTLMGLGVLVAWCITSSHADDTLPPNKVGRPPGPEYDVAVRPPQDLNTMQSLCAHIKVAREDVGISKKEVQQLRDILWPLKDPNKADSPKVPGDIQKHHQEVRGRFIKVLGKARYQRLQQLYYQSLFGTHRDNVGAIVSHQDLRDSLELTPTQLWEIYSQLSQLMEFRNQAIQGVKEGRIDLEKKSAELEKIRVKMTQCVENVNKSLTEAQHKKIVSLCGKPLPGTPWSTPYVNRLLDPEQLKALAKPAPKKLRDQKS